MNKLGCLENTLAKKRPHDDASACGKFHGSTKEEYQTA